jgi:hypothetical protein
MIWSNALLTAKSLRRGGNSLKWPLTALPLLALFVFVAGCQRAGGPARTTARQQVHEFTPAVFYNEFSATTPPVLRVSSGDSIHTTTIDAAGTDDKGAGRAEAGNPQTGPFYIEGAEPGDTVAIHVTQLRLNRGWAISTDTLSNLAITPELAARMNGRGQLVRWRLEGTLLQATGQCSFWNELRRCVRVAFRRR